jgi:HK97 family phage major capsid protein
MKAALITSRRSEYADAIPAALVHFMRYHRSYSNLAAADRSASPVDMAMKAGASATVLSVLKAATAALSTGMTGGSTLLVGAVSEWAASLGQASAFAKLFSQNAFRPVPFRLRTTVLSEGATGAVVGEGMPVPVSSLSLSGDKTLEPEKISALLVLTNELWDEAPDDAARLIERELQDAAARTLDAAMLDRVLSTATPSITASADPDDAYSDLNELLAAIGLDRNSRLAFLGAPDVVRGASTLWAPGAGKVFPDVGPSGGSILGSPVVVCDALGSGEMVAIDASRIAGRMEGLNFSVVKHASLQVTNPPTQNAVSPTESSVISLWQNNLQAARVDITFGCKPLRDGAAALLVGVPWGDTGSPA